MVLHAKSKLIPNYQHISLTIFEKLNVTCPLEKKTVIWDPLQQFSNYIADIKCKVCDKETHFLRWKNGTDGNEKPRTTDKFIGMAMIVTPVYVCKFRHETLGTDANILQKIPIQLSTFVLLHKTGKSMNLYEFLITSVINGSSISAVENSIRIIKECNFIIEKNRSKNFRIIPSKIVTSRKCMLIPTDLFFSSYLQFYQQNKQFFYR